MPTTIRRRRRGSRRMLTAYRVYELLTGEIVNPVQGYDGYGDGKSTNLSEFICEQMKADWLANRQLLLEVWHSGKATDFFPWKPWLVVCRDDPLPWAQRQFSSSSGVDS